MTAAAVQGQVNLTVLLGDELVLRIPRTARAAEQLAKEAEVIPLVRAGGVPTPEMISYDPSPQVATVPYMVIERVDGTTLADLGGNSEVQRRALETLGEILASLHRIRHSTTRPIDAIPDAYTFSPSELIDRLVEAGEIGTAQRDWLTEQFRQLRPDDPSEMDPVLVHRDVIPSNVMVDASGRVTALLDWGCAEWGAPARDLVGLPIRSLPDLVSGYRRALSHDGPAGPRIDDGALERDALRFHLYLAFARLLKEPSTSEDRNWAAPRSATLTDLLAFISGAGSAWPELLGRMSRG